MKKHKFLFLLLLGLFLFFPHNTNALSITAYRGNYQVINTCNNCTALTVAASDMNRVRYTFDRRDFYANNRYKMLLDMYVISQSHGNGRFGTCIYNVNGSNLSGNTYAFNYFNENKGMLDFYFQNIFTFQSNNLNASGFVECDVSSNFGYVSSIGSQSLTYSNEGTDNSAVIQNSTDKIINNNNTNTDKIIESNKKTQEKLDTAETTRKGILQQILDLPGKFLDMLKSLFIPADDYFSNKFDDLLDSITNKLGILGYPFVLVLDTFDFFLTVEDTGSYLIEWDNITVPNFEDHVIIPAGSFDFSSLLSITPLNLLHNLYFVFINALLILSFFKLCNNTYARIFGGEVDEVEYLTTSEEFYFDKEGELTGSKSVNEKTIKRSGI